MNDAEPEARDALERAIDFLWPHYTDFAMPKMDYAAQSPECQRLARVLAECGDQRAREASEAEIARLRAPPEADVMVRAHRAIAEHVAGNPDGTMWWVTGTFVETVAGLRSSFIRELTEYGDQRAREERAEAIEDAAERLDATYRDCIERASAIPDFETAANWKRAAHTYAQAAQYVRALAA